MAGPVPPSSGHSRPTSVIPPSPRYWPTATSDTRDMGVSVMIPVTQNKDGNPAQSHGDEVDDQEGASAIFVAEVGESPNISEANRDRDTGEQEVQRVAPVSALLNLVIDVFGHVLSGLEPSLLINYCLIMSQVLGPH